MNLPLFIAKRLYHDRSMQQRVSRPAITIATAGVAIGLAVMMLSVFVVLGFKHTIRDKVIGFGAHIQVNNFMTQMSSEQPPIAIGDSMMHVISGIQGVAHVERFAYKQGILKTDSDFLGVMLQGVAQEYDTTFLHRNLVAGTLPHFTDSVASNQVVLSQTMADKLKVHAGERIFAYFIDDSGVRMRRLTISAVYQTNLTQYDEAVCFTDLYTTTRLNGWKPQQVSGAAVTLTDFSQLNDVADRFIKKINRTEDTYGETYASQTIRDINPQIFSWLDLLDMNVWIILALMVCVAGVTMVSGLLIIILERTAMIGVLKALGARGRTIRHIFLWFAAFIIGRALLIGNVVALALALLQQHTGLASLDPHTYYVSTVPVEISLPAVIVLNAATLLISLFVLIAPSYLISHIHPARSMRYE